MASFKVKNGITWKPDELITKDDLKEGWVVDDGKCDRENILSLTPLPPALEVWFDGWFKNFWKYHRRM